MIDLSIPIIEEDIWFIDSKTSYHFTFQKEIFSPIEEFVLGHKIYIEDNNINDVCVKNIILFKLSNGDVLYVLRLAKKNVIG